MNKRGQWRGVMLTTMAVMSFGLSVRSYAATTPAATTAAPTIERYNPYLSGDRMVFTQVTRQPDDSTTAAIWSRDLATGRESLVAAVGTGEAMPVTSGTWTAWSEMASDTHVSVKARSNRGGPVLDVFTTQASPFEPFGRDPNQFLTNVSLVDNQLLTTNGIFVSDSVPELVRFDLPQTRPQFLDIDSSDAVVTRPLIAATAKAVVVHNAARAPGDLLILDNNGRTKSRASTCTPGNGDDSRPVIDGNRVAVGVSCGFGGSIATCTLPCAAPEFIAAETGTFEAPRLALSGDTVAFAVHPALVGTSQVVLRDLSGATPLLTIRTTSSAIGPRVTLTATRVAWDEYGGTNGALTSRIYVYDRTTKVTTVIEGDGSTRSVAAPAPVRLDPDVSDGRLAYTEVPITGVGASVWVRSLTGRPTLVSTAATDGSAPVIGSSYAAWTTLDERSGTPRVVANRIDGRGPLVDVFSTVSDATVRDGLRSFSVDMDGDRAIVSSYTTEATLSFQPPHVVLSKALPGGAIAQLSPPLTSLSDDELTPVGNSGRTAAVAMPSFGFGFGKVALYGTDRTRTLIDANYPQGCPPTAVGLTAKLLVVYNECGDDHSPVRWCALPCANGLDHVLVATPASPWFSEQFSQVSAMAVSDTKVILRRVTFVQGGRLRSNRLVAVTSIEVVDLDSPAAPPRLLAADIGRVSVPRIDGSTVVWSVDKIDRARTGTIWTYDLGTNVLRSI